MIVRHCVHTRRAFTYTMFERVLLLLHNCPQCFKYTYAGTVLCCLRHASHLTSPTLFLHNSHCVASTHKKINKNKQNRIMAVSKSHFRGFYLPWNRQAKAIVFPIWDIAQSLQHVKVMEALLYSRRALWINISLCCQAVMWCTIAGHMLSSWRKTADKSRIKNQPAN